MAIKANLRVDQGTDFAVDIQLKSATGTVYNLTGHTVAAQMRKHYAATTATTFTASVTSPATSGVIKLELTNSVTDNLVPGRYLYDVEITDGSGKKSRVVEGVVTVTPSITRV